MLHLPDDILDTIYKYKHQLEYEPIMYELTEWIFYCKVGFLLLAAKYMRYRSRDGTMIYSVNVYDINVSSSDILRLIRNKKYNIDY